MTSSSLLRAEEGLPRGVLGAADPRFANVVRIFAGLFPGRRFGGGALSVYIDGKPVVDVWTGWSDRNGEVPWATNTGAMVFSATKGVAAAVVHRLVAYYDIDPGCPRLSRITDSRTAEGFWPHRSRRNTRLGRSVHRQRLRLCTQPVADADGVRHGFVRGVGEAASQCHHRGAPQRRHGGAAVGATYQDPAAQDGAPKKRVAGRR
jgi:hypothetical protein